MDRSLLRIIVIGSRFRPSIDVTSVLDRYDGSAGLIMTGGSTGAEAAAKAWANEHGVKCMVYEPDWDNDGVDAIFERNTKMVDDGADVCLAFPMHQSTGTVDCVEKADCAGIPTTVIMPPTTIQRPSTDSFVSIIPDDEALLAMTGRHLANKYKDAFRNTPVTDSSSADGIRRS